MISGLFVRHYGIYKNINYIPLSDGEKFTSIIGDNGVGKSSVFDALDKFMNPKDSGDWIINKQARIEGGIKTLDKAPFIAPCFLIKHSSALKLPRESLKILKIISNYFWSTSKKSQLDDFFLHREKLIQSQLHTTHYLIVIGKLYEEKDSFFFTFESELNKYLEEKLGKKLNFRKETSELLNSIIDNYTYLYIPVETNVGSFSKLDANNMQVLMDKNIQDTVGRKITDASVNEINKKLDEFLSEIESALPNYTYKATGRKTKLTKLDIVQKTIESYFSIKVLHKTINKSEISIDNLSSGEKRRAIVDLAYSFLAHGDTREKDIILAIDEPESSLHIDGCFEQFERLKEISDRGNQILITTHWYGHLPITTSGKSILIKKEETEIKKYSFNLSNYREQLNSEKDKTKSKLPYNVQLKSYNDLAQSIIASLQSGYNWIICEGSSEKIYFEYYFTRSNLEKIKILPAGGAPEVIKIAKYLQAPLQDKELEPKGKIICLIDTDSDKKEFPRNDSIKCLVVKRIRRNKDSIVLEEISTGTMSPVTEIEDALDSELFLKTLASIAPSEIIQLTNENNAREAKISGYCLDLRESQKEKLDEYFSRAGEKYKFAKKYVEIASSSDNQIPEWIKELFTLLGAKEISQPIKPITIGNEKLIKAKTPRKRPRKPQPQSGKN